MATSDYIYEIQQGTPAAASLDVTFIGTGSSGTRHAKQRLVHPNSTIPPLVFFSNPERVLNFDNEVLLGHRIATAVALENTRVIRFDSLEQDMIVTLVWTGNRTKAAMPTFFFRLLYDYYNNAPAFSPTAQEYIQWEPRDRTTDVWNVEVVNCAAGQGGEGQQFDIADVRGSGGIFDSERGSSGQIGPLDTLNTLETGLVDVDVVFQFKIVSKV